MDRRSFVSGCTALLAATSSRSAAAMSGEPVVETSRGKLRGVTVNGSHAFKGIRYATADRFMPPRAPEAWSGVRDAIDYGAIAPQTNANPPPGPPYVILAQLPRPANAPPPVRAVESEDCLFLNVWTPTLDRSRALPVMVWLHGGFFYGGSGSTGDGSALAARGDVVVVSLNHRLNAFGFTHLADHSPDHAHAGNAGMLDIIAALRWVQDNIAGFGGDPKRVMVFGASGGGMKTSFLMASPRARGLFARAGVQSGPGLRFMERARAAEVTDRLFAKLSIPRGDVRALQALPMDRLLAGYHAVATELPAERFIDLPCFAPVIDPELLPRHPFSPDAAPLTAAVPMLIGWNAQEMSFFMGNDPAGFTLDDAGVRARFDRLFGSRAAAADAFYRRRYPTAAPSRRYIQANSDYSLMLPTLAQADRNAARGGAPTFVYRFDRQSPALGGKLGALHTSETPYVFAAVERSAALTGNTPEARTLAAQISSAWVQFAATGRPGAEGLPAWPAYTGAGGRVMLLDDRPQLVTAPQAEERALLKPLLGV